MVHAGRDQAEGAGGEISPLVLASHQSRRADAAFGRTDGRGETQPEEVARV